MEITIWKSKGNYNTTIYETYKASKDKKGSITLVSKNNFIQALKIAYNVIINYKWLLTSSDVEVVKTNNSKKYYPPKKNKK